MTKKLIVGQDQIQREVEMTAEEEAQLASDQAAAGADLELRKAADAQRIVDEQNANQKLIDLGLSQPEIDALLGK